MSWKNEDLTEKLKVYLSLYQLRDNKHHPPPPHLPPIQQMQKQYWIEGSQFLNGGGVSILQAIF